MSRNGFIYRYVGRQEKVHHICRQHWIVLSRPIELWLAAVVIGVLVAFRGGSHTSTILDRFAGWLVLTATLYAVWQVLEWWLARYVITNERVVFIQGILTRKVSAVPLSKVTDTTFRRTPLGLLLNYGDLLLDAPGERPGLPTLTKLPNSEEVYRLMMTLIPEDSRAPAGDEEAEEIRRKTKQKQVDKDQTQEIPRFV